MLSSTDIIITGIIKPGVSILTHRDRDTISNRFLYLCILIFL